MVKFGKKFFFDDLPENNTNNVEPKKSKEHKRSPKKSNKKIDLKKVFTKIKETIANIVEIIVGVLKRIWPIIILIVLVILLLIGIKSCSKKGTKNKKATPTPVEKIKKPQINNDVKVSIFEELPTAEKFITNMDDYADKKITISYEEAKLVDNHYEEVGEYKVTINIENQNFDSKITVEDKVAPTLTTKNVVISEGATYKIADFIEKCEDNSKKDCSFDYKDAGFGSYTAPGKYEITIIAKDVNGNVTEKTSTLTINKKVMPAPTPAPTPTPTPVPTEKCKYGTDEYDSSKYTLSYKVSKDGCAINKDLAYSKEYNEKANEMAKTENQKLVADLSKKDLNMKIELESFITEVRNSSGKGFVGYTIVFKLYNSSSQNHELLVEYALKADGSRSFKSNKIGL